MRIYIKNIGNWNIHLMTIQVFLSVGGENGILVKDYLKIPISPL